MILWCVVICRNILSGIVFGFLMFFFFRYGLSMFCNFFFDNVWFVSGFSMILFVGMFMCIRKWFGKDMFLRGRLICWLIFISSIVNEIGMLCWFCSMVFR